MPRYSASDIVHTAATDHRILKQPDESTRGRGPAPLVDGLPLTPFHPRPDMSDPDLRRDLGVALAALLEARKLPERYTNPTLDLLDEAVKKFPRDATAGEARARLLAGQVRPTDALAGLRSVLAVAPDREGALAWAAALAVQTGHEVESLALWRRAVAVNPWNPDYRRGLATLLLRKGDWDGAAPHARAWAELSPFQSEAHRAWRDVLLRQGKRAEADAEQAILRALQAR
jgi:tetratricopeptide (TPR) repeat protein